MVVYDKFGRTWDGRKIVWIRSSSCARLALYRWDVQEGQRKLIYDKKRGMYDKNGYHIKEMHVNMVPALEGKDEDGHPVPDTWERFPDTEEAYAFTMSIAQNGIINQKQENVDNFDEYDEEIMIR